METLPKAVTREREISLGLLPEYVGYPLRLAQLAVSQDFIQTLDRVALRPGQFSVLTLIEANPGILQRHACEVLAIKTANLVPLLSHLEARGLTKRTPIDRRSNGLHLTAKGRALLKRAKALCDLHQARITATIGEGQRETLIDLLFRISEL